MYCKFCGRQIAEDSKFCEFCGNLVQNVYKSENEPVKSAQTDVGAPILKDVILPDTDEVKEQTTTFAPPSAEPYDEAGDMPEELEDLEDIIPQNAVPPKKKKKNQLSKKAIASIVGGSVALIGVIVLIVFLATRKPTVRVDVSEYVDFKISGYDGYGVATCEVDWTGLETAALGEYPTGTDSKTKKKQAEYREKIAVLKSAIKLDFTKKENVSVGDILKATITVNTEVEEQLGIQFAAGRTVEYTVKEKDLNGSSEFDLAEELLDIKITGLSGQAKAEIVAKSRKEPFKFTTYDGTEYQVGVAAESADELKLTFTNVADQSYETVKIGYSLDKSEGIQNGDKITLSINAEAEKTLMDYGLSLSGKEKTFTAEKLNVLAQKVSQVDKATLAAWTGTYAKELRTYVLANWAQFIHEGNNVTTVSKVMDKVTLAQKALVSEKDKNTLYLIYSATVSDDAILLDSGTEQTLYFAVAVRNIVLDSDGKLIAGEVKLPSKSSEDYLGAYADLEELNGDLLGSAAIAGSDATVDIV